MCLDAHHWGPHAFPPSTSLTNEVVRVRGQRLAPGLLVDHVADVALVLRLTIVYPRIFRQTAHLAADVTASCADIWPDGRVIWRCHGTRILDCRAPGCPQCKSQPIPRPLST